MVSFQCEGCGDVQTKKKLDQHYNRCRAPFSCIDCMVTFQGTSYKAHNSCMTEDQKYQGALYKEKKKGGNNNQQQQRQPPPPPAASKTPRHAYVEDADPSPTESQTIPPPAPSPPSTTVAEAEALNIYDYLSAPAPELKSSSKSKKSKDKKTDETSITYGSGPVPSSSKKKRRSSSSSDTSMRDAHTPKIPHIVDARPTAVKTTSDKKRKRQHLLDDVSASTSAAEEPSTRNRLLHSGLTGGLDRMLSVSDRETEESTPIAATKRGKQERERERERDREGRESSKRHKDKHVRGKEDESAMQLHAEDAAALRRREEDVAAEIAKLERRKARKALEAGTERKKIEYPASSSRSIVTSATSPADAFLKMVKVDEGSSAGSSRGQSVWGALKMWRDGSKGGGGSGKELVLAAAGGGGSLEKDEKKLWKGLRMRVNEKGEVVLFAKDE